MQSHRSLNYQDQENNWLQTLNWIQLMKVSGVKLMTIPINILFTQHLVTPPLSPNTTTITPPAGVEEVQDQE